MTLRDTKARVDRALMLTATLALGLLAGAASAADVQPMLKGARLAPASMDADAATLQGSDDPFHSLFQSWQREDAIGQPAMSVPSSRPLNTATFTSGYGVRSDPFRGQAAMHAGIDLAAPTGTAVYATADGMVDHASWEGGYGNMVEIEHGKGLSTRFGHLSRVLVHAGQMVHRGDLIALVGSTGRSTGPHLHYEVRIDGRAVNPVPFLQASDYVVAMREHAAATAQGGPDDID
jgi:murein DD-endopeptidase MepM/ murein hydrolase activator NlpD